MTIVSSLSFKILCPLFFFGKLSAFKGLLIIFLLYSILCDHWTASRHNPISFIFYLCLLMNSLSLKALNNSSLFIVVSPWIADLYIQNSHLLLDTAMTFKLTCSRKTWTLFKSSLSTVFYISMKNLFPLVKFLEFILLLLVLNFYSQFIKKSTLTQESDHRLTASLLSHESKLLLYSPAT